MTDRRKSWFPYALQSAAMMHSTLAMVAALWRAEHQDMKHDIFVEGLRQKGEAIKEIRTQLPTSGDRQLAFLMSAMSTLVIVEVY